MKIRFTDEGKARVRYVRAWWRLNRDKAPDLFEQELERVLVLLATSPEMGERYKKVGGLQWYRVLLEKTRQHAYYWIDREHDVIEIASVWGARRGSGPPL